MNIQEPEVQINNNTNGVFETITKIIQSYVSFLTSFTFGHPIHPSEPAAPQYSDYLLLNHRRRLRIIHIKPNSNERIDFRLLNFDSRSKANRGSLSEEYWFTRWNRPLKLGNCNCSFRRSQRFSTLSNQQLPLSIYTPTNGICVDDSQNFLSSYDIFPIKIIKVETFVERLIEETIFEAFQEYLMRETIKEDSINVDVDDGVVNFGYLDDVELRHPRKATNSNNKCKSTDNTNVKCDEEVKEQCTHEKYKQTKKKPIVILLHGIASSADVWWQIINTLIYKGYEVVAPDMLGHGYSSVPNNASAYKFKNLLKYTLAVFDQYIGYDESKYSIVIGHSFGCSLATALYRYRSRQVIQLILISGGGPTPLAPPASEDSDSTFNCLQTCIKPLLLCGVKRTVFYSTRGKHFNICSTESAVPSYILKYIAEGQDWPEGDAAFHRRILVPTLLVHGLQDTQVTLVQECEMERTIPRAFLELIPNAGHLCMLETPEHLNHMIMCFIDWWSR